MATIAMLGMPLLLGCDSTQERNERAKLSAQREIAAREPQTVTTRNPEVTVTSATLVRGGRRAAVVVELRSSSATPLTDVPITAGVRRGGREVALNAGRDLGWFQTHVPAIPARGTTTWVLQVPYGRRTRSGEVAFARAGVPRPRGPVVSSATELPSISAVAARQASGRARVTVENTSDVPQFGLQLYAYVRDEGRYVAAGATTVKQLAREQQQTVSVPLTGRGDGPVQVEAIPTIFQ